MNWLWFSTHPNVPLIMLYFLTDEWPINVCSNHVDQDSLLMGGLRTWFEGLLPLEWYWWNLIYVRCVHCHLLSCNFLSSPTIAIVVFKFFFFLLFQESFRHSEALDAVTKYLDMGTYSEWDEEKKLEFLTRELKGKRPLVPHTMEVNWLSWHAINCEYIFIKDQIIQSSRQREIPIYLKHHLSIMPLIWGLGPVFL